LARNFGDSNAKIFHQLAGQCRSYLGQRSTEINAPSIAAITRSPDLLPFRPFTSLIRLKNLAFDSRALRSSTVLPLRNPHSEVDHAAWHQSCCLSSSNPPSGPFCASYMPATSQMFLQCNEEMRFNCNRVLSRFAFSFKWGWVNVCSTGSDRQKSVELGRAVATWRVAFGGKIREWINSMSRAMLGME
jgi:hypothetical protein